MTETKSATGILLYGHQDVLGDDPHQRVIEISRETYREIKEAQAAEWRSINRYEVGDFVLIQDLNGVEWEVASAPCGLGCHCAAVIRAV